MSKALNTVTSRDTELTQQNIYTMLSSLTLFNMYTLDLSTRLRHTQFINYSEGITVTATHSNNQAAKAHIPVQHPHLIQGNKNSYLTPTKQLVHSSLLILKNITLDSICWSTTLLDMHTHLKILDLIFNPKLNHHSCCHTYTKSVLHIIYHHSITSATHRYMKPHTSSLSHMYFHS